MWVRVNNINIKSILATWYIGNNNLGNNEFGILVRDEKDFYGIFWLAIKIVS